LGYAEFGYALCLFTDWFGHAEFNHAEFGYAEFGYAEFGKTELGFTELGHAECGYADVIMLSMVTLNVFMLRVVKFNTDILCVVMMECCFSECHYARVLLGRMPWHQNWMPTVPFRIGHNSSKFSGLIYILHMVGQFSRQKLANPCFLQIILH
jgi:hypothetical protein